MRTLVRYVGSVVAVALLLGAPRGYADAADPEDGAPPAEAAAPKPFPDRHSPPRFLPPFRTLRDPGGCRFLSFSPDELSLASTNRSDEVRLFSLATGEITWTWKYPELLRTSLGDLVWPFCPRGEGAWEKAPWRLTAVPGRPKGWPGTVGALFAPRGAELAVVHNPNLSNSHVIVETGQGTRIDPGVWLLGGYVHFFEDRDPGVEWLGTLEADTPERLPLTTTILHGLAWVNAFDYAPSGDLVATGSSDGELKLWTAATGSLVAQAQAEPAPYARPQRITALDFSSDGQHVATIGDSGAVRVWSVPGLAPEAELVGHAAPGFWVQFSPDASRIASAAEDGDLRLWDPATAMTLRQVDWLKDVGEDPLFSYSPVGILYAATRKSAVIGVLAEAKGGLECTWSLNLRDVAAFTASPRGDLLAVGDRQGQILVWRVAWPQFLAAG